MGLMGEASTAFTVFIGKTSSKYEDNDKMDHNERSRTVWPRFICFRV
jgi:hypothetical protein